MQNNQEDMCLAPQSSPVPGNHRQWADPPRPIPCFIMALTLAGFCLTLFLALSVLIPENSLGLPLPSCPHFLEGFVHCYPGTEMPSSSHTGLGFAVLLHRLCNELTERLDHKPRVSAAEPHSGHHLYLLFHSDSQNDSKDTFKV